MTADPYGTSSEIPAAACTWPDHGDVGCPRCAVLLACRGQVPKHYYQWATRLEMRSLVAPQVADRLLAWLRWPGTAADGYQRFQGRRARGVCAVCDREYALDSQGRVYSHARPDGRPGQVTDMCPGRRHVPSKTNHEARSARHPLDGTDVAGLRPCTVGLSEEEIAMDLEWQMRAVHDGLLDGGDVTPLSVATDWPAVAVVADYLSTCGGWRWVHDFREQMTDEEFYRLPPVQDAMRAMGDLWVD